MLLLQLQCLWYPKGICADTVPQMPSSCIHKTTQQYTHNNIPVARAKFIECQLRVITCCRVEAPDRPDCGLAAGHISQLCCSVALLRVLHYGCSSCWSDVCLSCRHWQGALKLLTLIFLLKSLSDLSWPICSLVVAYLLKINYIAGVEQVMTNTICCLQICVRGKTSQIRSLLFLAYIFDIPLGTQHVPSDGQACSSLRFLEPANKGFLSQYIYPGTCLINFSFSHSSMSLTQQGSFVQVVAKFKAHQQNVRWLDYDASKNLLYSCSFDRTVKVWAKANWLVPRPCTLSWQCFTAGVPRKRAKLYYSVKPHKGSIVAEEPMSSMITDFSNGLYKLLEKIFLCSRLLL